MKLKKNDMSALSHHSALHNINLVYLLNSTLPMEIYDGFHSKIAFL